MNARSFACRRSAARLLLGLSLLFPHAFAQAVNGGAEGPWDGFPRTHQVPRYEDDPGADPGYHFGVTQSFSPYRDPDRTEALPLPNPLDDPDFASYNLIVVVSKADNPFWGREQTLRVYKRGVGLLYYWLVSTGMAGHETAAGYFSPKSFSSRHWSSEYDAPMLWAVFFHGGMALHSSLDRASIADMGKAAESHGCVHEEDYRAEEMFHLIGQSGYGPVDQINERTGRRTGRTVNGYKALIIIGPVTPWTGTRTADAGGDAGQPADARPVATRLVLPAAGPDNAGDSPASVGVETASPAPADASATGNAAWPPDAGDPQDQEQAGF